MKARPYLKTLATLLAIVSCVGAFSLAKAQGALVTEYYKTIKQLGAQSDRFYVTFNEPFSRNCVYGVAYIASDRKGLYAQLLAAKLSGKHISRFDYLQPDGDGTTCNVELVEITE